MNILYPHSKMKRARDGVNSCVFVFGCKPANQPRGRTQESADIIDYELGWALCQFIKLIFQGRHHAEAYRLTRWPSEPDENRCKECGSVLE